MKKLFGIILTIAMIFCLPVEIFAAEEKNNSVILLENGYTEEMIKQLPDSAKYKMSDFLLNSPNKISISAVCMEVDTLKEIELLFRYSEEEIAKMGAHASEIKAEKEKLLKYYEMDLEQLATDLNISITEAKLFKKAIKIGLENHDNIRLKNTKNEVTASGSITSAEMRYVQTVMDYSTSSAPSYDVYLSYNWNTVYFIGMFNDSIPVAWGGNLNSKNIVSSAKYYFYTGETFDDYNTQRSMNYTKSANAGIVFTFPQAVEGTKTKSGYIQFSVYQTKFVGFDTDILSQYCHKTLSITGASISISENPVAINVGTAYDSTTQRVSTIGY